MSGSGLILFLSVSVAFIITFYAVGTNVFESNAEMIFEGVLTLFATIMFTVRPPGHHVVVHCMGNYDLRRVSSKMSVTCTITNKTALLLCLSLQSCVVMS